MLPSLILPKFSPPRKLLPPRPAHLYLVKALLPLAALSLLLLPLPSYAGHWVITLDGSTTVPGTTGTGNYTFANSQVTGPNSWSATNHIYFDVTGGSCSLGLPGSLSTTATLTWTKDSPTDTSQPPPTVDVLETVSAGGAEWMLQPTGVDTSASDGFGDPVTNPTAPVYGASSSGKHLYQATVSPGQMSVTLPTRSLSASLTYETAICTSGTNEAMGYSAQVENALVMNIIPLRVDATTAHNSRVLFRVEPANATARTVTFTAPDLGGSTTSQTLSNVSGEFGCNFDEGQIPGGSSNFVLQWTPGDNFTPLSDTTINAGATRARVQSTGFSSLLVPVTVGDNIPTGTGGPDATIVFVPVAHHLYEYYDKFSYSLPVVPESETIHIGNSNVNIQTTDSPVIPSIIDGWGENHYYVDDNGVYANGSMQSTGVVTLPAQSNYFQSKEASSDLFFAPNHNLVGVSQTTLLNFGLDDSPQIYWPYFYLWPTIKVPIN